MSTTPADEIALKQNNWLGSEPRAFAANDTIIATEILPNTNFDLKLGFGRFLMVLQEHVLVNICIYRTFCSGSETKELQNGRTGATYKHIRESTPKCRRADYGSTDEGEYTSKPRWI